MYICNSSKFFGKFISDGFIVRLATYISIIIVCTFSENLKSFNDYKKIPVECKGF
jgi:hypothetical protein